MSDKTIIAEIIKELTAMKDTCEVGSEQVTESKSTENAEGSARQY